MAADASRLGGRVGPLVGSWRVGGLVGKEASGRAPKERTPGPARPARAFRVLLPGWSPDQWLGATARRTIQSVAARKIAPSRMRPPFEIDGTLNGATS